MRGCRITRARVDQLVADIKSMRQRARDAQERRGPIYPVDAHELGGLQALVEFLVTDLSGDYNEGKRVAAAFDCKLEPTKGPTDEKVQGHHPA